MQLLDTLKNNIGERIAVLQQIGEGHINYFGKLTHVDDKGFRMDTHTGYTEMVNVRFDFNEPSFYHSERKVKIGDASFDLLNLFRNKLRVA